MDENGDAAVHHEVGCSSVVIEVGLLEYLMDATSPLWEGALLQDARPLQRADGAGESLRQGLAVPLQAHHRHTAG